MVFVARPAPGTNQRTSFYVWRQVPRSRIMVQKNTIEQLQRKDDYIQLIERFIRRMVPYGCVAPSLGGDPLTLCTRAMQQLLLQGESASRVRQALRRPDYVVRSTTAAPDATPSFALAFDS